MSPAPLDRPLDRAEHRLPGRSEHAGDFAPTQPPRPDGQEPLEADGGLSLPFGPRHRFDANPTPAAVDPAHRVHQEDRNAPQGNVLKPTWSESVIRWPPSTATRTDRPRSTAGAYLNLQTLGGIPVEA